LFVAVVLSVPLLIQNLTKVASVVPEALPPFVLVSLTTKESSREPSDPAVNTRARFVPAESVPSKALVFVIAVDNRTFITPRFGVRGKIGDVFAGILKTSVNVV
jgi:hypothetical protein